MSDPKIVDDPNKEVAAISVEFEIKPDGATSDLWRIFSPTGRVRFTKEDGTVSDWLEESAAKIVMLEVRLDWERRLAEKDPDDDDRTS